MVNEAENVAFYAAFYANAKTYESTVVCRRCGTRIRYVKGRGCVECAARHRQRYRDEKARRRARLRPLKGTVTREGRLRAIAADKVLRDFARFNAEKVFKSRLRCKNGHEKPDRYVTNGGCVTCQKQNAAARYARKRKPRGISYY